MKVRIELDFLETRIIGCLIEKQITTPDQYPLSLNALVNACNQKSNRDPVIEVDEPTVQRAIDGLSRKHLVLERSGFGSRVPKYQQLFCNTEYGSLKFSPLELAVVCELLLRGPQTPGELRSRANRMAPIADVSEVENALQKLAAGEAGALVERLPLVPGRRESRYRHLFGGDAAPPAVLDEPAAAKSVQTPESEGLESRVAKLEEEVRLLRAQIAHFPLAGSPGRPREPNE